MVTHFSCWGGWGAPLQSKPPLLFDDYKPRREAALTTQGSASRSRQSIPLHHPLRSPPSSPFASSRALSFFNGIFCLLTRPPSPSFHEQSESASSASPSPLELPANSTRLDPGLVPHFYVPPIHLITPNRALFLSIVQNLDPRLPVAAPTITQRPAPAGLDRDLHSVSLATAGHV